MIENWNQMSPSERRVRIGQFGVREAILALGRDAGIAWLQEHIESPVSSDWGRLLLMGGKIAGALRAIRTA